jgi:hypothetical protein
VSSNQAASEVRIAKSIGYRIIAKKAVRAVLWLILLAAVVYVIIAGSMARYVATDLGTLKVVSTNFPGGQATAGTAVAIDPQGGQDDSFLKNLLTAVTPHGGVLIGEIVEGPFGSPDWESYGIDLGSDDKLSNSYVFKCLEGCEVEGSYGVVENDQIMGIPVER